MVYLTPKLDTSRLQERAQTDRKKVDGSTGIHPVNPADFVVLSWFLTCPVLSCLAIISITCIDRIILYHFIACNSHHKYNHIVLFISVSGIQEERLAGH